MLKLIRLCSEALNGVPNGVKLGRIAHRVVWYKYAANVVQIKGKITIDAQLGVKNPRSYDWLEYRIKIV
ncbi:hypothetical protein BpHYR1_041937 [Brachionus plicatilis]|uniref:Uncharacterized protein n=1 Tax=Brachionus plicatilis TaxID=10195 RepID=A0A3M7QND7_BRAPC|nr:hypothetical protein BpHYR1_041937 [Brachionus plicatilis]